MTQKTESIAHFALIAAFTITGIAAIAGAAYHHAWHGLWVGCASIFVAYALMRHRPR